MTAIIERSLSRGCSLCCEMQPLGTLIRENSSWSRASSSYTNHGQQTSEHSRKDTKLTDEFVSDDRKWFNNRFHYMRWVVILMSGMGMFLVMFGRFSITVAIIDMVNQTSVNNLPNHVHYPNDTGLLGITEKVLDQEMKAFDWDNTVQAFIISVYMIAYGIPQVPLSFLVERRGGHMIGFFTHLLGIVALASIPLIAHLGWEWVAMLRVLVGVAHSCILTIGVRMISVWIPDKESNFAVTVLQLIGCAGVVFNPLMSGYLTSINWVFAFYIPSFCTLIWCIFWLVLVKDDPKDSWLVSKRELEKILSERNYLNSLSSDANGCDLDKAKSSPEQNHHQDQDCKSVGIWSRVAKMPRIYAIIVVWMLHCSSGNCFIFSLPSFLLCNGIGDSDIAETGRWVFYVQLGALVSFLWGGQIISWLMNRQVSKTNARRVVYTMSTFMASISWILPAFLEDSAIWTSVLNRISHPVGEIIVIGTILDNFTRAGISASVFGIVNTLGNGSIFPSNIIIGRILDVYGESLITWHSIYIGFGLMNFVALFIFLTMCDSEPVELNADSQLSRATRSDTANTNRNKECQTEKGLSNLDWEQKNSKTTKDKHHLHKLEKTRAIEQSPDLIRSAI